MELSLVMKEIRKFKEKLDPKRNKGSDDLRGKFHSAKLPICYSTGKASNQHLCKCNAGRGARTQSKQAADLTTSVKCSDFSKDTGVKKLWKGVSSKAKESS